jgi:translation initiation factor IF-2
MTTSKIKVYELAKELGHDSQHLVDVIQRLGIDIKNTMSVLGSEEVRSVREYFRKNRTVAKSAPSVPSRNPMTEKRVGATVIRRRAPTAAPQSSASGSDAESEMAVAEAEEPSALQAPELETQFEEETVAEEAEALEAAPEAEQEQESEPEAPVEPPAPVVPERILRQPSPTVNTSGNVRLESHPTQSAPSSQKVAPPAAKPAPPTGQRPEAPPVSASPTPPAVVKPRRVFPSIIKKVATEQYLGEVVGPKMEKRPPKPPTPAPGTASGLRPKTGPGSSPTVSSLY